MPKLEDIISGKEGRGFAGYAKPIADQILCADGTTLSVQASRRHYCHPKNDYGPYVSVEVGFPTSPPPESWELYDDGGSGVWGHVPVELVREYVASHGGELGSECDPIRTVPASAEDGVEFDLDQYTRSRDALRRRLHKEHEAYGSPIVLKMSGKQVRYEGKGDRFEFRAYFEGGLERWYEVTSYGKGRSYKIWEI